MLSRSIGAILVAVVGVAAAPAQPVVPDLAADLPPPPSVLDGASGGTDGGFAPSFAAGPDPYRWWLSAEYLLGFTKSTTVPTVLTGGSVASGGVLGAGGVPLFGKTQNYDGISGARFGGGVWLDGCRAYGLEWGVFFLPTQRDTLTVGDGGGVVARPFFDTALGTENSRLVSAPGLFSGTATSTYSSRFWGAELGALLRVVETPSFALDQVFHFRHFTLEESLELNDRSTGVGGGVVAFNGQVFGPPATVSVRDFLSAVNRWYGGSAGLRLTWTGGRWEAKIGGRLGVGASEQTLNFVGTTTLTNAGPTATVRPGFYTAAQALGQSRSYRLSFAPDVQVGLGYRVTDWLMLTGGYQFQYITNVVRASDMVERRINPGLIPSGQNFGAAAPAPTGTTPRSTDFWMHGLTAGLMLTF